MNLKGTKTEANLITAFLGESGARNKYTFFASQARKDGYIQIAKIFEETANNEKEHAKLWFKLLNDGIGNTEENLKVAAEGENEEWTKMYMEFAEVATEEGFYYLAELFRGVAKIEREHEVRYLTLLKNLEYNNVFNKDSAVTWQCGNCGYTHYGDSAPEMCSICKHPKSFFEVKADNY